MASQLDKVAGDFRAINDRARAVVDRVGVEGLSKRPAGGGWSLAEIFEHLNMTTRAFAPRWRQACTDARARGLTGDGPYATDFWGKALVWVLEPPYRMRMPTTPDFQPLKTPPPNEVLDAFLAAQDQVLGAIEEARGLAIDRVRVRSPFQEKMQYSVWSSFRITAAHQRRHLWQAERID